MFSSIYIYVENSHTHSRIKHGGDVVVLKSNLFFFFFIHRSFRTIGSNRCDGVSVRLCMYLYGCVCVRLYESVVPLVPRLKQKLSVYA